ncbi:glutaredoxin family protein [Alteribacter keqinensis]|uniref:Glutaredoxin family protein n=2 Tax=Bacillaceae TaxID=186817 RepID=A0A3M7TUD2_9BACI|nr:glutaredoxin family protein [Alteribacter keqinensis]
MEESKHNGVIIMSQVIVYSTQNCVECDIVKQMLKENNIDFEVRDVMSSREYQKEVEGFGIMGVPVTVFEGEAVKGMNPELQTLVEKIKQTQ